MRTNKYIAYNAQVRKLRNTTQQVQAYHTDKVKQVQNIHAYHKLLQKTPPYAKDTSDYIMNA